jgi:hypothetical protein
VCAAVADILRSCFCHMLSISYRDISQARTANRMQTRRVPLGFIISLSNVSEIVPNQRATRAIENQRAISPPWRLVFVGASCLCAFLVGASYGCSAPVVPVFLDPKQSIRSTALT